MLRGRDQSFNDYSRIRVWDAPVRVVHWLVAALILAAWLTREAPLLDLHAAAGYVVLALCLFRIAWGFVGTRHARFRDFVASPRAVLGYLRSFAAREPSRTMGHNPAGGWWILLLLAFELAVTASGVVAIAGMHEMGPLAGRIPHAPADLAMTIHSVLAWWMLGAIAIHVLAAIATGIVHRENLVAAMVDGIKRDAQAGAVPVAAHRALAIALVAACALGSVVYLWQARTEADPPAVAQAAVPAEWRAECESCHLAYPPCLLPPRSWTALFAPGADHFGEDLALTGPSRTRLVQIAAAPNPAESWACWKMRESIPAAATPLRITAAPYWKKAHARIAAERFKPPRSAGPHDCGTCHKDSLASTFRPRALQDPH